MTDRAERRTIAEAGNVVVPAILALEAAGYRLTTLDGDLLEASSAESRYVANDPLTLLGLVNSLNSPAGPGVPTTPRFPPCWPGPAGRTDLRSAASRSCGRPRGRCGVGIAAGTRRVQVGRPIGGTAQMTARRQPKDPTPITTDVRHLLDVDEEAARSAGADLIGIRFACTDDGTDNQPARKSTLNLKLRSTTGESLECWRVNVHARAPRLPGAGVAQSMGRTGSCLGNAAAESFDSTLEFELLRDQQFATREQARRRVAGWIDEYNTIRRHSTNGMLSPVDYERVQAHGPGAHPGAAA